MGHESLIEPWLPPDNRSACWFQSGLASSRRDDENRWERKPDLLGRSVQPSPGWRGRSEPTLFNLVGLEGRERSAVGGSVSLDFPLIEPIGFTPPEDRIDAGTCLNIEVEGQQKVAAESS